MDRKELNEMNAEERVEFFLSTGNSLGLFSFNPSKEKPLQSFPFEEIEAEKVVFYPGTFSPWHKGHRACLEVLPSDAKLSVVVIPDFNPWKEVRDSDLVLEVQNIWESLEDLKEKRSDLSLHLYLGFLAEKKKNPTYHWLKNTLVKKRWLLMGEDSFLDLDQWAEAESLLKLLDGIYVVPREAPADRVFEQKEKLQKMAKFNIIFLDHHKYEHFSSTYLREKN